MWFLKRCDENYTLTISFQIKIFQVLSNRKSIHVCHPCDRIFHYSFANWCSMANMKKLAWDKCDRHYFVTIFLYQNYSKFHQTRGGHAVDLKLCDMIQFSIIVQIYHGKFPLFGARDASVICRLHKLHKCPSAEFFSLLIY